MVITKPAIASRPEFETNPSNMLRMLKDIYSIYAGSRKRKKDCAGRVKYYLL